LLQGIIDAREPLRLATLSDQVGSQHTDIHPLFNRAFLGAPIISSSHLYGWLYLMDKMGADEFSEADERLAVTLTAQVAVAYENACLYTEARINAAELAQEIAERKQAEEERARLLVR
jgi:GAF domain-containing protein